MNDNPLDSILNGMRARNGGAPDDDTKRTIGYLGARVTALETQVRELTHAVIVLVNAKGSGGTAPVPMSIRYREPRVEVEWSDGEPGKVVGKIRIRLTKD